MTKNKVLYILPQPFFIPRGSSFRAMATLEGLSALGYEVDLLCFKSGPDVALPGLRIFRVPDLGLSAKLPVGPSWRKLLLDLPLAFMALWLQLVNRYSAIHGVEEGGFIGTVLGLVFKKPYIFDMHSWMSEQLSNHEFMKSGWLLSLFTKVEMFCMRRAAAIITVGQHMAQLLSELGVKAPVYILYDLPLRMDVSAEITETIRAHYASGAEKILVYTGNFHSYQGIDLLLESIKEINQIDSAAMPLKLLLVGGGQGEAELVRKYKQRVQLLGIGDQVIFCGERSLTEVQGFVECADLLVSPRISGNNVPLKVYSYLAAGKIIVATSISSHTQVLDEDNAILGEAKPKAFAEVILKALQLPEERALQLRENAKLAGNRERRWAEFTAVLDKCYQNLNSASSLLVLLVILGSFLLHPLIIQVPLRGL